MRLGQIVFWAALLSTGLTAQQVRITRFDVTPSSIIVGQEATLTWTVENASTVTISPGVGVVPPAGSRVVFPTVTTTYTLQATNGVTSDSRSLTVTAFATTPSPFTVTPLAVDFGEVPYGSAVTRTLTINVDAPLTITLVKSLPNTILASGGDRITVTPAEPGTITVTFQPGLPVSASGGITLISNTTGTGVRVTLSGTSGNGRRHTIISQAGSGGGFTTRVLAANLDGGTNMLTLFRIGADGQTINVKAYSMPPHGTLEVEDDETRRIGAWTPQWIWLESDADIAAYAIQEYENTGARAILVSPAPSGKLNGSCVAEWPVTGTSGSWPHILVDNLAPDSISYTLLLVGSDGSTISTTRSVIGAYSQETWDLSAQPVYQSVSSDFAGVLRLNSPGPVAVATSGATWPQLVEAFGTCGNSAAASSSGIAMVVQGQDAPARLFTQNASPAANAISVKRIDYAGNVVETWNTTIAGGGSAVLTSTLTPENAPELSWYGIEAGQTVNVYTDSGMPARAQPASASFVVPVRIAGGDTGGLALTNPGPDAVVVWLDALDQSGTAAAHTCYTLAAGNGAYIQSGADPALSGLAGFTGSFWINASRPIFASLVGITEDTLFAVPAIPLSPPGSVAGKCPADSSAPLTSATRPRLLIEGVFHEVMFYLVGRSHHGGIC